MEFAYKFVIVAALISVAIILFLGLKNMATGGSPNVSQKLMRMRILFQAIAVVILMFGLFVFGR